MKVYIASKYIKHKDINNKISQSLIKENIEVFLPKSINVEAVSKEQMYMVSEICYNQIEQCDIILIVCPFGKSVSSEFGYAIALKRLLHMEKKIVALNVDFETEAMIYPYVDKFVESISELIAYLKEIQE